MNDSIARARLEGVPKPVRDALVGCREDLPAGAIIAVGRFSSATGRRKPEESIVPSAQRQRPSEDGGRCAQCMLGR